MPEPIEITEMKKNYDDRDYVVKAVNQNGKLLEFAAEEFRNDRKIVLDAVKNNPEALEFASYELKKDREIVFESVSKLGWTYCYVDESLKDDKELLLAGLEKSGQILYFASEKMRDDKDVVLKAIENKPIIIKYASKRLRSDLDVGIELMNKNKTKVSTLKTDNFEQFRNKTKNKSKKLAFTGLNGFFREPFANLTDLIENSNTFRLIGPDAPMIAGRIKTSRNKYEALENAVIDLSGVFLYNYCAGVVQKALRKPYNLPSIAPTLSEIIASKDENTIKNAVKKLNEANKTLSIEELFDSDTAKEIYKTATYGKYGKINKYVKKETLDGIDSEVCEFLKKFAQSGEKIANYTKKANNKNAIFMAIGFLVAIIGQAYLVPKIAFAITKKLTGKDEFSGIADYSDIKKEK